MVNKQIQVYGAFTLSGLVAGDGVSSGVDGRVFTLGGGYAL
jgi:hypothetical protein